MRRDQVEEAEDQVRLQGRPTVPERGQDGSEVRKAKEEDVGAMRRKGRLAEWRRPNAQNRVFLNECLNFLKTFDLLCIEMIL